MNPACAAEADRWREQLLAHGFGDDGVRLTGPLAWRHPEQGHATARVEITLTDAFPFAAPQVRLLEAGAPFEATFHLARPEPGQRYGVMCLWEPGRFSVEQAPWRDPAAVLARVVGWLEATAKGWPDDTACDLDRHLEPEPLPAALVLYDADALQSLSAVTVRVEGDSGAPTVRITHEIRRMPDSSTRGRRKDRRLAWIGDLGEVRHPVRDWSDVAARLGPHAATVGHGIGLGVIDRLLLRYRRNGSPGVLVVRARTSPTGVQLRACEAADTSAATRSLRAGTQAREIATRSVALVGCGAIGSFLADILHRSGVRRFTLIDPEVLRPGNLVRHLAGEPFVGWAKVRAVQACLSAHEADSSVTVRRASVTTLKEAVALIQDHDVVIDATASAATSSLLATAAQSAGRRTGHIVVSVCVQREGGIARVDRFPLRSGETHLPGLPSVDEERLPRERGCGSAVSLTPPGAVIEAAELGSRVVIDHLLLDCLCPPSLVDVRVAQPEEPFNRTGLVLPPPRTAPGESLTAVDLTAAEHRATDCRDSA